MSNCETYRHHSLSTISLSKYGLATLSDNKVDESLRLSLPKVAYKNNTHISFAKTQNLQKSKYLVRVRECYLVKFGRTRL